MAISIARSSSCCGLLLPMCIGLVIMMIAYLDADERTPTDNIVVGITFGILPSIPGIALLISSFRSTVGKAERIAQNVLLCIVLFLTMFLPFIHLAAVKTLTDEITKTMITSHGSWRDLLENKYYIYLFSTNDEEVDPERYAERAAFIDSRFKIAMHYRTQRIFLPSILVFNMLGVISLVVSRWKADKG